MVPKNKPRLDDTRPTNICTLRTITNLFHSTGWELMKYEVLVYATLNAAYKR